MQKKDFLQVMNKTLFTIKRRLLHNEDLRKLLYHTTPNALSMITPEESLLGDYICLKTIVNLNLEDSNSMNNFITIDMINADTSFDDNIMYTFEIKVYCSVDNLALDNDIIRSYAISQKIVELLDNSSVNTDGKLDLTQIKLIVVEDRFVGFNLEFMTIDSTSVEEFS